MSKGVIQGAVTLGMETTKELRLVTPRHVEAFACGLTVVKAMMGDLAEVSLDDDERTRRKITEGKLRVLVALPSVPGAKVILKQRGNAGSSVKLRPEGAETKWSAEAVEAARRRRRRPRSGRWM
jgi:hypothetical protein